jgi:hypothetical protein
MNRVRLVYGVILIFACSIFLMTNCNSSKGSGGSGAPQPPVVQVSVSASDAGANTLSYRWRSSDGNILDVNAPSTTWTLPHGPGLHFAYVLVSNGKGGYAEGRIAVNTDAIGTPAIIPSPQTLEAPPAAAPQGNIYRSFVRWANINFSPFLRYAPDIFVYLQDPITSAYYPPAGPAGPVRTNRKGEYLIPGVPAGSTAVENLFLSDDGTNYTAASSFAPMDNVATTDYLDRGMVFPIISGTFLLADGTLCGIDSGFFGVHVSATATLLDGQDNVLAGPVRTNAWGQYGLRSAASAAKVSLKCESAAPVNVPIPLLDPNNTDLGLATLPTSSAPVVSSMAAALNGMQVGTFLPPPAGASDIVPRTDTFLSFKGVDSRSSACRYYQAVGAVKSCDAQGYPSGAVSFEDWKRTVKIGAYSTPTATEYDATYVNRMDLNLTRRHHSISYGPNQTAAYVCNHLGPPLDPTQEEIDTAIDNALNGENIVACVAMDYSISPGVNGDQPFIRYMIFSPGGQLLTSVNLDGRGEKFVPGACVACHGGDHYAGRFPEDGAGPANVGAHFLPYDTASFLFSSKPGLTEADQSVAIKMLNQNVLNAGPTVAEQELIAGWYSNDPNVLDKNYIPASWSGQDATAVSFYRNVYAPICRSCHVALVEGYNFDHFQNIDPAGAIETFYRGVLMPFHLEVDVCGPSTPGFRRYSMPNSLVTFNRFWDTADGINRPQIVAEFLYGVDGGGVCALSP